MPTDLQNLVRPGSMGCRETHDLEGAKLGNSFVAGSVWAGWLQVPVLILAIVFVYHRIIFDLMMEWWTDSNSSHGFIVLIFSGWIIWRTRRRIAETPVKPNWCGFIVVIGALVVLLLGTLGAENFLSRTSLLILLAGLAIYFRGWPFFRSILFPWVILFLTIPLPTIVFNEITLPLQFQASSLASGLLRLTGVPVLRDGNLIELPSLTLEVAEACSGLRSLISLITMAVLYSYVFEARIWRRILLILVAIPIAVAANAIRIMGSGMLGQYWNPSKAEGFFHTFSGWLIFLVSLGLLLAFHQAMSWLNRQIIRAT